jgi:hypothetical protein
MNYAALEIYKNMPESDKPLYNGRTIEQIRNNMHPNMCAAWIDSYIDNCTRVIECQMSGKNLNEIEDLKNYNFNLLKLARGW